MSHRCIDCGGQMTSRRETRKYGLGIDVVLKGIEVRHCGDCGEEHVVIPRIKDLHTAVAKALINQPRLLTHGEIRFLRTYMGFSSKDFAEHMGVTPETVSRWENPRNPMKIRKTADRFIRFSVGSEVKFKDYQQPPAIEEDEPVEVGTPKFGWSDDSWEPVAVPG